MAYSHSQLDLDRVKVDDTNHKLVTFDESAATNAQQKKIIKLQKIRALAELTPRQLDILFKINKEINLFCQSSKELDKLWARSLNEAGHGEYCEPMSDNDKYSSSNLIRYLAVGYLDEFNNSASEDHLEKACARGLYKALQTRLERSIAELKDFEKKDINSPACKAAANLLLKDATYLSQAYWAPGCVAAIAALTHLVRLYDAEADVMTIALAQNFSRVKLLQNYEESKKLASIISPENNLIGGFAGYFKDWEQAETFICDLLVKNCKLIDDRKMPAKEMIGPETLLIKENKIINRGTVTQFFKQIEVNEQKKIAQFFARKPSLA